MTSHRRAVDPASAVRDLVGPALAGLGLAVEEVTVTSAGSRRVLRVVVDLDEQGVGAISLDQVAQASREVSVALDDGDLMRGAAYVLEVTSPGVGRRLTQPRHFRRNIGRTLTVACSDGSEVVGRLLTVVGPSDGLPRSLGLRVPGPKKGTFTARDLAWSEVASGRVEVEFRAHEMDPHETDSPETDSPEAEDDD